MSKPHPPFPTTTELRQLIADREKALDHLEQKYKPRWALDRNDEALEAHRKRERKITRQTTRLDKATRKFETDFDMSS